MHNSSARLLKVTHVNTLVSGGAAIAARRLHDGFLQTSKIVSRFVCGPGNEVSWADSVFAKRELKWPLRSLHFRWKYHFIQKKYILGRPATYHSDCEDGLENKYFKLLFPADIIHLHWIAHFVKWSSVIPWILRKAPIVWTLHDMNPFQGIWHYTPSLDEITAPLNKWDRKVKRQKHLVLSSIPQERLKIVAPSKWMTKKAQQSVLMRDFDVQTVPYGLDTHAFSPLPKSVAKRALGLPLQDTIIGFIEDGIGDPRKGFDKLREALLSLQEARPILLTAGSGVSLPSDIKHLSLGRIHSPNLLKLFYSALDIFICPSLQDNLPNTVLESLSCGTPVISFNVGGLSDMVRPGETGWLVSPFDTEQLAKTIYEAGKDSEVLKNLSHNCRNIAIHEYSLNIQAERYQRIYECMINENKKKHKRVA